MHAHQNLGRCVHCVGIKVRTNAPYPALFKCERGAAIEDAILVGPANAAVTRMPVVGHFLAMQYRDGVRPQMGVDGFHQSER